MGLYKRIRISTRKIEIEAEEVFCENTGLYILSHYPNLEYSNDNFFSLFDENYQWYEVAQDTIIFTVINLLVNKTIELYKCSDRVSYFWGTFNNTDIYYSFRICNESTNEDLLSDKLLTAITQTHRRYKVNVQANANDVIKNLISSFPLYQRHYFGPDRIFLIENLKSYSEKYPWLSINAQKGIINIITRRNKIDLERIYLPRISMQIEELRKTHINLLKSNWEYGFFITHLKNYINDYFIILSR